MRINTSILICFFYWMANTIHAQDISLLQLDGLLPSTFLNPGLPIHKNVNVSIVNFQLSLGTDGPSINNLTSKNSKGERYFDPQKVTEKLDPTNNIFLNNDIHTLDLGLRIGKLTFLAGHAFRSSANLMYTRGLVEIASQGNAAFIGKPVQIGPSLDVLAYNEIYLGAQKTSGKFTIGVKFKLLYGAADLSTEKSDVIFTTKPEFYQLQLENDYLVRSSGLLKYNSFDSITLDYPGVTFDNLFYNNRGFAADLGVSFKVNDKLTLSASALDIGSIKWDFYPRKYTSKGKFTFDGLDIVQYLGDTTSISISDTILNNIDIVSGIENYSTSLNSTFSLSGTFKVHENWTLNALYLLKNDFGYRKQILSASSVWKFSFFDIGIQYAAYKNNYKSFGLFGKLKLGPFSGFVSTDNIIGLFKPLDHKNASIRIGTALQF